MRPVSSWLFLVLFMSGVILIYSSFCIFVETSSRSPTAWLNLSVIYAIYLTQFGRFGVLFTGVSSFEKLASGIGISWLAIHNYAFWSVLVMIVGFIAGIGFQLQLILQLTVLLITMFWFAAAIFSMEHVASCERNLRATHGRLDGIRRGYQALTMASSSLNPDYSSQVKMLAGLREDADYFSGIVTEEAAQLDSSILKLQGELQKQIQARRPPVEIDETLRKLCSAMTLRKSCRSA